MCLWEKSTSLVSVLRSFLLPERLQLVTGVGGERNSDHYDLKGNSVSWEAFLAVLSCRKNKEKKKKGTLHSGFITRVASSYVASQYGLTGRWQSVIALKAGKCPVHAGLGVTLLEGDEGDTFNLVPCKGLLAGERLPWARCCCYAVTLAQGGCGPDHLSDTDGTYIHTCLRW